MEKRTPHYKLTAIKKLIAAGNAVATASATASARAAGVQSLVDMCDVILALEPGDFYKSMTTRADHRIWQDVYHSETAHGIRLYIKLTVIDDVLIVSFKEL